LVQVTSAARGKLETMCGGRLGVTGNTNRKKPGQMIEE